MKFDANTRMVVPAPCGLNCTACYAHLRKKRTCPGCRGQEADQPLYCQRCKIRICALAHGIDYCSECSSFPCAPVKQIDKRYRLRYQISLIENLARIKSIGVKQFLLEEEQKWTCMQCGGVICIHDHACSACGRKVEQTV